ncbi:serine/arginine-rich splicing factor 4-like isoform X2 [Crassostrea virginica]|uniref:Serine/arginine-rich splicing factor 6-like isoform X2 n=1 Tax=Crassostrea virginica TaxID=6565 RepID=A0A8B8DUT6_CRAVI|nr:serine/arginine-rich splicing factor 6-like isoform X2 [Crassostrea virginica]
MGTRVYIGRLSHHARERDVERFFKGYGRLRDVMLKNGYGFVEFEDYRDADDAVYELNGKDLAGERVIVEHARGGPRGDDRRNSYRDYPPPRRSRGGGGRDKYGPPTRTEYRLIVENLSSRVSWQDLKDYMRQAGEVTYADAHKEHKNEGIVEFAAYSDMKNAISKLDGTEINGRKIKLVEDKPKRSSRRRSISRSASRSRSRSRSRRRSRSGSRSRSRSRSRSSRSKSKSKSKSPDRKSRSKSPSKSRSRSKSPSKSKSKSRSRSRSKSRSPSPGDKEDKDEN